MIDTIEKIEETEWGLSVVLKDGITIDDNNVLPTIEYVIKELIKFQKKKVIIDATSVNRQVSVLRLMDVAELIQKCTRVKMAFVTPKLADDKNSKAMETFAFNRGVFVQYFHDKLSALDWLLQLY